MTSARGESRPRVERLVGADLAESRTPHPLAKCGPRENDTGPIAPEFAQYLLRARAISFRAFRVIRCYSLCILSEKREQDGGGERRSIEKLHHASFDAVHRKNNADNYSNVKRRNNKVLYRGRNLESYSFMENNNRE